MDRTSLTLWRSLISQRAEQEPVLLGALTSELIEQFKAIVPVAVPLDTLLSSPLQVLDEIHFSWFAPFLRSLTEREIKLFLAALLPQQAKGLKHALMLSNALPTVLPLGETYLRQTLFEALVPSDFMPVSYLPPDPLNTLLRLSFEKLLSVIDLIAMHDLSIEIRHIIDTSKLKEIHALLTKPQLTFLKTLLHKKEPIAFKKMGLLEWQKDHEALHLLLTHRGINRVAKALYVSHPALVWHIAHRLDNERGQLLLKLASPLDHPKAGEILRHQVMELVDALNTSNGS